MEVATTSPRKRAVRKIPDWLVYEMVDGKPIYYKGYKELLKNNIKIEQTMPESGLQIWLKSSIGQLLAPLLKLHQFIIVNGELGLKLGKGKSRGADVSIYRKGDFQPLNTYLSNPPEVIIEIDISADLEKESEFDYLHKKLEDYHQFGVKKVIWIFTRTQKVMIAEVGKPWLTVDWDTDIETVAGVKFNVREILAMLE